jgi:hypothetical protein
MPTSPEVQADSDCEILYMIIVNDTASNAAISVYDLDGVPFCLITPRNPLPAGATWVGTIPQRMRGGFTWSSSISGVSAFAKVLIL